jgi:hypothetical protein
MVAHSSSLAAFPRLGVGFQRGTPLTRFIELPTAGRKSYRRDGFHATGIEASAEWCTVREAVDNWLSTRPQSLRVVRRPPRGYRSGSSQISNTGYVARAVDGFGSCLTSLSVRSTLLREPVRGAITKAMNGCFTGFNWATRKLPVVYSRKQPAP